MSCPELGIHHISCISGPQPASRSQYDANYSIDGKIGISSGSKILLTIVFELISISQNI